MQIWMDYTNMILSSLQEKRHFVAIMDDLLATGGTMKATGDLVRKIGGEIVSSICIIELHELGGWEKLDFPFEALLQAPLDPLPKTKTA